MTQTGSVFSTVEWVVWLLNAVIHLKFIVILYKVLDRVEVIFSFSV